ncbi:MHYT domain-containing protein [Rhodovulum sp. 12E13]|uniref:MHYT domain-containing protein n=1 Tax=Rhodovulum sp. 12E13 TaxID=2203891 RepID=UPI001F39213E|nr:MHYT domain-containing protein [Rhodovulum sp. 12E13]
MAYREPGHQAGEGLTLALDVSHDPLLVVASFAIALMAGFTGLCLTRGAQALDVGPRKRAVAASAIVLGGGIWSMHFVAMLGLQLPIPFFYDALTTLISALVGILIVGLGLILLHFRARTASTITLAGLVFGVGILAMHYIGMAGMEACRAAYAPLGLAASATVSLGLSVVAIRVAYGERTRRNIVLGTVCFAVAVVALHYLAIAGTRFFADPVPRMPELTLGNEMLALVVTLASFAICGGFLLSGATFLPGGATTGGAARGMAAAAAAPATATPETALASAPDAHTAPADDAPAAVARAIGTVPEPAPEPAPRPVPPRRGVPYEQNGRTLFADPGDIAAFRAEGHYTVIYRGEARGFCPWSISEAERRLAPAPFVRAHRSYLINPAHVSAFERKKDGGIAYFDGVGTLGKVPVSRSRLPDVRAALGL